MIPTYEDDPSYTIESVRAQHNALPDIFVAVGSKVSFENLRNRSDASYFYVESDLRLPIGIRIARSLNFVLERVDLAKYDYVLRVDADAVLPPLFTESNAMLDADMVGESVAMLIKPTALRRVLRGRFPEVAREDTFLSFKLQSVGYKVSPWRVQPAMKRRPGVEKPLRYFIDSGAEMWRWGYEPLHVLGDALLGLILGYNPRTVFEAVGYFRCMLTGEKRYGFAYFITRRQLKRIFRGIRGAVESRKLYL